jgi:hypothetical protein
VHPTGMAVDLRSPHGRCRRVLRTELLAMERAGALDATEERRPPHFHLTVFLPAETSAAARVDSSRPTGAPPVPLPPAADGVRALLDEAPDQEDHCGEDEQVHDPAHDLEAEPEDTPDDQQGDPEPHEWVHALLRY